MTFVQAETRIPLTLPIHISLHPLSSPPFQSLLSLAQGPPGAAYLFVNTTIDGFGTDSLPSYYHALYHPALPLPSTHFLPVKPSHNGYSLKPFSLKDP
jgi:hypothetical protein